MFRSGYSLAEVSRELNARYFIDPMDAAAEATLLKAGATPALIADLKNNAFAVPADKVGAARKELAVAFTNGNVIPFDDRGLEEKKLIALHFSAY